MKNIGKLINTGLDKDYVIYQNRKRRIYFGIWGDRYIKINGKCYDVEIENETVFLTGTILNY